MLPHSNAGYRAAAATAEAAQERFSRDREATAADAATGGRDSPCRRLMGAGFVPAAPAVFRHRSRDVLCRGHVGPAHDIKVMGTLGPKAGDQRYMLVLNKGMVGGSRH